MTDYKQNMWPTFSFRMKALCASPLYTAVLDRQPSQLHQLSLFFHPVTPGLCLHFLIFKTIFYLISSDSSFHPLGLSMLFCIICLLRHFTSMLQEKQLIHYQYFHSTVFSCCLLFLVPVSWTVLNSFNTYFDFFFFAVAIF